MKKLKKKQWIVICIAFVAIISTVIGGLTLTFSTATNKTVNLALQKASESSSGVISEYNSSYNHRNVLYAYLDNSVAYCINYGKSADNGQVMTSASSPNTSLSSDKKKLLAYCLYYGHSSGSRSSNKYVATQAMVWNIVKGLFNTSSGDSAAKKLCNTAPDSSSAYSYYTELKAKMLTSYNNKKPSFAAKTKSNAKTYTLKWSEKNNRYETTIKDTNKSIGNYNISLSDYKIERNGNSITIYTKKEISGTKTGTISTKSDVVSISANGLTYWKPQESYRQEFISGSGTASPLKYYIKVVTQTRGKLTLTKTDADTGELLKGAKYGVYSNKACTKQISTLTTNVHGVATLKDLKDGTYYLKEITAPKGYSVSSKVYTAVINQKNPSAEVKATDTVITVTPSPKKPDFSSISIEKTGEKLNAWKNEQFVYTDSSLEGAEYSIIAAADIIDDAGDVKYRAGDIVETVKTDVNGKATSTELYYGTYSVKEISAPEGYLLDSTEQSATLNDKNGATLKFTDARQKVSMSIKKLDSVDNSPVKGAEFGLYAAEDIKNVSGEVLVKKGNLLEKATSDAEGNVTFTKDYPLGTYLAREISVPEGYIYSKEEVTFDADYQGQEQATVTLKKEIKNTPTNVEITKEDITTGKELSGAKLTVKDKKGNVIDTWESVAGQPHKITKLIVGETYTLTEEIAPTGYLIAEDVTFEVKDTADVQKVTMKDTVPTGSIEVIKTGETLESVTESKEPNYHHEFKYNVVSLAGITFDVTAAEKVVSADGQNLVYYEKGAKVGTLTTDANGSAVLTDLPLGKYIVKETTTLDGYVLDTKEYEVNLKYEDQNTKVVTKSVEVLNKKQRAAISVIKQDADTTKVISGAAFVLYTKNDIVNNKGKVLLKAGSVVEKAISDNDGNVVFSDQLPNGVYLLEEETAPVGYVKQNGTYEIDASYNAKEGEVLKLKNTVSNKPTKVDISKKDITGENELEGAKLTVLDSSGNVIDTWVSETTPHRITALPIGKYTLREETAPYGYTIANDVTFEITETEEIQQCVMKDETVKGQVIVYKTDDTGLTMLEGAEFEIKDADGNVVETITSNEEGVATSSELPAAKFENGKYVSDIIYTIVETKAPEGYTMDTTEYQVSFPYVDDKTPLIQQSQTIANTPTEIVEEEMPNAPVTYEEEDDNEEFPFSLPKTGDSTTIWIWGALIVASIVGIIILGFKLRKPEPVDDKKQIFKSK